MRLAFDLDNTLIRCVHDFPLATPQRRTLARLLSNEQLRHGTKALTDYCRQRGWEVWVYTTSYCSAWRSRRLFWLYGIRLDGVVNLAAARPRSADPLHQAPTQLRHRFAD